MSEPRDPYSRCVLAHRDPHTKCVCTTLLQHIEICIESIC